MINYTVTKRSTTRTIEITFDDPGTIRLEPGSVDYMIERATFGYVDDKPPTWTITAKRLWSGELIGPASVTLDRAGVVDLVTGPGHVIIRHLDILAHELDPRSLEERLGADEQAPVFPLLGKPWIDGAPARMEVQHPTAEGLRESFERRTGSRRDPYPGERMLAPGESIGPDWILHRDRVDSLGEFLRADLEEVADEQARADKLADFYDAGRTYPPAVGPNLG